MSEMILGTVQLGLNYGIHNDIGKPSEEKTLEILDFAFHKGIDTIDTAISYGESEKRIGIYIANSHNEFKICTKLPVHVDSEKINEYFENSRASMAVKQFDVYYLHRFEHCKDRKIMEELVRLKKQKRILNIGISIYAPEELIYIIEHLSGILDVIQLPFNLFDNYRWLKDGLLGKAKRAGFRIYCRSVFLQGLIFINEMSDMARKKGIGTLLHSIHQIARMYGMRMDELAVAFIQSFSEIDKYLVGCETKEQLARNIELYHTTCSYRLPQEAIIKIVNLSKQIDINIIDPRMWSES